MTMWTVEEAIKDATTLSDGDLEAKINALSDEDLERLAEQTFRVRETFRQENQLLFYRPVSKEVRKFHLSKAQQRVVLGGNGSSKSESNLVDLVIALTGEIPYSLIDEYPQEKLRPPISARLIVQSFTSTWEQTIKPKLQWDHWTGLMDNQRGHWGWIPKKYLLRGKWDESWSEKYRMLTLINNSTLQIMSHGQEVEDFASASLHDIRSDEGPRSAVWRENLMRLREGGYISLAMTPPDDQSASWDAAWVYDELYEKGIVGPNKDPQIESFTFFTEDNKYLADDFMANIGKGLSPAQKEVRFRGRFMHLGGRIYPIYTDRFQIWCFHCNDICILEDENCVGCNGTDTAVFNHYVPPFDEAYTWPIIFLLDPHPRKPNMMAWIAVDPFDDLWQVAELDVDGEPEQVRDKAFELERNLGLSIAKRLIDPNMGEAQAHSAGPRHITVRREFDAVGLRCDLADDNFVTGKNRLMAMLKPDPRTKKPRFSIFSSCPKSNFQMNRFSWGEWKKYSSDERDPKAKPREKHDDYPKLFGYCMNSNPTYTGLQLGGQRIRRRPRP